MWQLVPTDEFDRRLKQFAKKNSRELAAMLVNLDTYFETLQSGVRPMQVRHGFMHTETHGAIAIDQKGCKGNPTQTRLYVYADPDTESVHLITIGTKKSQRDDNITCREFIVGLRELKQMTVDDSEKRDATEERDHEQAPD